MIGTGKIGVDRGSPENRGRGIAVCLSLVGLLSAACSSVESPASGAGGADGTSGAGGAFGCNPSEFCVPSCATETKAVAMASCDISGTFRSCPTGTVRLASCAPNACARSSAHCCNDTTGALEEPICGPDGLFGPCAADSHLFEAGCIPSSLGVSTCDALADQSCELPGQQCRFNTIACTCDATDGGQPVWHCASTLLI